MNMFVEQLSDTIVACATARGKAGVAIVRLSGPDALKIAKILCPSRSVWSTHELRKVRIVDAQKNDIDDGMAVAMLAPHSFTGEDVVELHVHGSLAIVDALEAAAIALGARMARPGEFSRRAFINGQMSLTQAEALGALLNATDAVSHKAAITQLKAGLGETVERLVGTLEATLARFFAALDFPEYVPEDVRETGDEAALRAICSEIQQLIQTAFRADEAAWSVVLAGASNIGKSTLFNALIGEERALVDNAPGTTRDRISAVLTLGGATLELSDTAGFRDEAKGVEARGVALSKSAMASAKRIAWLVDPQAPVWPATRDRRIDVYGARADAFAADARLAFEAEAAEHGVHLAGWVSGRSGEGVMRLRERLAHEKRAHDDEIRRAIDSNELWLAKARHLTLLKQAGVALSAAAANLAEQAPLDLVALEVREAVSALGQIVGRDVACEVLEQIFAQFCIGK